MATTPALDPETERRITQLEGEINNLNSLLSAAKDGRAEAERKQTEDKAARTTAERDLATAQARITALEGQKAAVHSRLDDLIGLAKKLVVFALIGVALYFLLSPVDTSTKSADAVKSPATRIASADTPPASTLAPKVLSHDDELDKAKAEPKKAPAYDPSAEDDSAAGERDVATGDGNIRPEQAAWNGRRGPHCTGGMVWDRQFKICRDRVMHMVESTPQRDAALGNCPTRIETRLIRRDGEIVQQQRCVPR